MEAAGPPPAAGDAPIPPQPPGKGWRSARHSLGSSEERSVVPWILTTVLVVMLLLVVVLVFRQVSGSRGSEDTWQLFGDAQPYVDRALAARARGDRLAAQRDLSEAIQLVPTHPVALREMGTLMYEEAKYDLARRFLVRAIRADPTDKSAQDALACTLVRLGRTAEAQNFFARTGGSAARCG